MTNLPEETTNFLEAMNRMFSRSELEVLTKLFKDVAYVKEQMDGIKWKQSEHDITDLVRGTGSECE